MPSLRARCLPFFNAPSGHGIGRIGCPWTATVGAEQVREGPLGQRGLQVGDALAASGPALGADHPLDHLDVMGAPERQALVDLHQHLGQGQEVGLRLRVLVDADQGRESHERTQESFS